VNGTIWGFGGLLNGTTHAEIMYILHFCLKTIIRIITPTILILFWFVIMSEEKMEEESLRHAILVRHERGVYKAERGRLEAAIPNDMEVNLPAVFLSGLRERGLKAVNLTYGGDPFFKAISLQILCTAGVVYSPEGLKEDLVEFERKYVDYLKRSEYFSYVMESKADDSAFGKRVQDLEDNLRAVDSFDIYCMSLYLNVKIVVLYPDMIDKTVCECIYNESGRCRACLVLINDGWRQYNYAVVHIRKES